MFVRGEVPRASCACVCVYVLIRQLSNLCIYGLRASIMGKCVAPFMGHVFAHDNFRLMHKPCPLLFFSTIIKPNCWFQNRDKADLSRPQNLGI